MSTRTILLQSWDLLLRHYPAFTLVTLLHFLRNLVVAGATLYLTVGSPWSPAVVLSVFVLMSIMSYIEILSICLALVRNQPIKFFRRPSLSRLSSWMFSTACFCIALVTGLLLFIIPGVIVSTYWSMYGFAIADGEGPIRSLKTSYMAVRGIFWQVFLIGAIIVVPIALFSTPLFLGLDLYLDLALNLILATIYTTRYQGTR